MLYQMINDQIEFDTILTMLDRELFYLPEKVTIDDFKRRLAGKQYKESSNKIDFPYTIRWENLIPKKWIELSMNPYLLSQLESSVRCSSRFMGNLLSYQTLLFTDGASAGSFFELFKENSNWNYGLNGGISPNVQSLDKRYKVVFDSSEGEFYGEVSHQIMLIYK